MRKTATGVHNRAKLTWDTVREIRQRHQGGVSGTQMSKDYGVSISCVCNICRHVTWPDPNYSVVPPSGSRAANELKLLRGQHEGK